MKRLLREKLEADAGSEEADEDDDTSDPEPASNPFDLLTGGFGSEVCQTCISLYSGAYVLIFSQYARAEFPFAACPLSRSISCLQTILIMRSTSLNLCPGYRRRLMLLQSETLSKSTQSDDEDSSASDATVRDHETTMLDNASLKSKERKRNWKEPLHKTPSEESEDLDSILKELNITPVSHNQNEIHIDEQTVVGRSDLEKVSLLAVDARQLKPDRELRRMFGSSSISAVMGEDANEGADPSLAGASRRVRRLAARGLLVRAKLKPGTIVAPREEWPKFECLMEMKKGDSEADGTPMWRYVPTAKGGAAQEMYEEQQMTLDPNAIAAVLQAYPWHTESLLTMADTYRMMGENAYADEFVDRCLYALEMAWPPGFKTAFAAGKARVVWDKNSSSLFHALFRKAQMLGRRGLHQTALEVCKLLWQLDPEDPMGARMTIDYFALRSGDYEFVKKLVQADSESSLLPNMVYSAALARWYEELDQKKQSKSHRRHCGGTEGSSSGSAYNEETCAGSDLDVKQKIIKEGSYFPASSSSLDDLVKAMLLYPFVAAQLQERLQELNAVHPQWQETASMPPFKDATDGGSASLSHLVNIFVERQHLLWKAAPIQEWFLEAAVRASAYVGAASGDISAEDWAVVRSEAFPISRKNEYEHLHVFEFSDTVSRLPPELVHGLGQAGGRDQLEVPEDLLRHALGELEDAQALGNDRAREELQRRVEQLGSMHPVIALLQSLLPWWTAGVAPSYQEEGDDPQSDDQLENGDGRD